MKKLLELEGVEKISREKLQDIKGGIDLVYITIYCNDGYGISFASVPGSFDNITGVNPDYVCINHGGHDRTVVGIRG